jgi:tryptophan-rich sensory protein
MKNPAKLLISVVGCELVGILGTPFTAAAIPSWYATLEKPLFAPPNWLFGPAWTLLYFLMGVAFYLIWQQNTKSKKVQTAQKIFFAQLFLNFIWSPLFFGLKSPLLGLIVIVALWGLILLTIYKFYPLSKWAAYLLIPYLLWVTFATSLNAAILILN